MMTQNMDDSLLAHLSEDGRSQSLEDHLRGTARRAESFASAFGAETWGRAVGLLHDDGKASDAFQRRIRGEKIHVDHSTSGAKTAIEFYAGFGKLLAYCVAGHHAGLPDGKSGDDPTCLHDRLGRAEKGCGLLSAELPFPLEPPTFKKRQPSPAERGFSYAFFTRMLFSTLVDADFLDTEAFLDPPRAALRSREVSMTALAQLLDAHLDRLIRRAPATPVNKHRARILAECRAAALLDPGLFSLSVPTGGGKTLSSLAFAISHALAHGMHRIIYVIPYTSIIEQTARIFKDIFGPETVLEHHSNIVHEKDGNDEELEECRLLAAENWDVPIVVTTNVQFFESFFANRSSRTRRLHNVARSVVILDEAQMLPVPLLRPCLAVIRELTERYGTSLVLCTATQPALSARDDFRGGLQGVREIVNDPESLEIAFERVSPSLVGELSEEDIVSRIQEEERCLCIVNTRRHARLLFQKLENLDGVYHLSASMCPVHRAEIIGSPVNPGTGTIRRRLLEGAPCRVVSTQLVEAGVDLDFPVVFRSLAGLDSIVQAAGRCNREGVLAEPGRLYVFSSTEFPPPGHFRQNAQITALTLRGKENRMLASETVLAYFRELYWIKDQGNGLDSEGIMDLFMAGAVDGYFPFKTVASRFRLIDDAQIPVIVPYDDLAAELCEKLRFVPHPGWILRRLQPYTVQVYPRVLAELRQVGYVESVQDNRYHVLTSFGKQEAYSDRFGLNPEIKEFYEVENLII